MHPHSLPFPLPLHRLSYEHAHPRLARSSTVCWVFWCGRGETRAGGVSRSCLAGIGVDARRVVMCVGVLNISVAAWGGNVNLSGVRVDVSFEL